MSQQMLAIWSLVPLPFLKPAWTSGSSQFTYCWSLAWRILSITLLACEMSAIARYFKHSLALPFFGIGIKTDLFQSCGHCWVFQICSLKNYQKLPEYAMVYLHPIPFHMLLHFSVQFSSVAQSCLTLCCPMNHSTPGLPVHHHLPEFTQTHVHQVSDAIQPSHPLSSLFFLPPIPPSIRVFSNESNLCMRWTKYWSFSFSIIPSKEHPGLISFRMDWLDLLVVQGVHFYL